MWRHVAKRLGAGIVLVVAVATLAFVLLMAGQRDVGRAILGVKATQEQVAQKNHDLGLDQPLVRQFGHWARGAVTGNLGTSWFNSTRVWELLKVRIPVTISVVALSILLAAVLALVLGVTAAVVGGRVDRGAQLIGVLGFAIPGFLIAFGLVTLFSVKFHIFRATGYVRPTESFTGWIRSVTLPVISLSFGPLAALALQVRGAVRDALDLDYVRTLRTRGLSARRTLLKHILRNATAPSLAVVGLQFIGLLGGAVIVEGIFAIPGLGTQAVQAGVAGDLPVVMGLVLVTAVLVVLVNLVVDLLAAWLNPKVRLT